MYYENIHEFIKKIDSKNIDKLKPQLMKYVSELILSIRDEDNKLSFKDTEKMLDIVLIREEFQYDLEKELELENSKFGLLTDEFMKVYKQFTEEIVKNGYLSDAISLTRSNFRALGCIHRDVYLVSKQVGKFEYMNSKEYLEDLQEQLYDQLDQFKREFSREYFNILGLISYIKSELEYRINEIIGTIFQELKDKSLDDFNKEDHIDEYKNIFNKDYAKELERRKYSWNVLSTKLQENYFRDELYKDLD
ncbi:hypothetical protein CHF27_009570 [Romboutsia maritimum]|uniref:Uncharacterized protein n=1 Tax=Romboutsia maritimum TaxID=2020948 RepID=A0A371IRS7_9FIRM|nr:hypothetical protein [Romboutsia maritimum]RDY23188.1 hypothetical protein CHF27_009570 [Romboutsia maritimum]